MNFYYFYKIKKFIKKKKKAYAKVNEKKSLALPPKIIKITSALPPKVMKKYFSPPAKVKKKNLWPFLSAMIIKKNFDLRQRKNYTKKKILNNKIKKFNKKRFNKQIYLLIIFFSMAVTSAWSNNPSLCGMSISSIWNKSPDILEEYRGNVRSNVPSCCRTHIHRLRGLLWNY